MFSPRRLLPGALFCFAIACVPEVEAPVTEVTLNVNPTETRRIVNGILCEASLVIEGTFEPDASMADAEPDACAPGGLWKFKAQLRGKENDCVPPPELESEYAFRVTVSEDNDFTYAYLTDPSQEVSLRVNAGGGGLCSGTLEVFSKDHKKVLTLRPMLQPEGVIDGQGDYAEYDRSQGI